MNKYYLSFTSGSFRRDIANAKNDSDTYPQQDNDDNDNDDDDDDDDSCDAETL